MNKATISSYKVKSVLLYVERCEKTLFVCEKLTARKWTQGRQNHLVELLESAQYDLSWWDCEKLSHCEELGMPIKEMSRNAFMQCTKLIESWIPKNSQFPSYLLYKGPRRGNIEL